MIKNNPIRILIVGIGNEYRSDDAAGLMIARTIRDKQLPFIAVKEEFGEGASLMEVWQGFQNVILVDAVSSGAVPGTIFRINVRKEAVPVNFFNYSTHAFSVAEAIELARVMNLLPLNFIIYGIEGKNFTAGTTISTDVIKAAKQVVKQIVTDAGRVTG